MSALAGGLFVPSVDDFRLPQVRRGGRPRRITSEDYEQEQARNRSLGSKAKVTDVSAPSFTLGSNTSVTVRKVHGKWSWAWPNEGTSGHALVLKAAPRLLFNGDGDETPEPPRFPLSVVIASATRYIHDTPDIYEPDFVAQLVTDELTEEYHREELQSGSPDPFAGATLCVVTNKHNPFTTHVSSIQYGLCFSGGKVGQDLHYCPFVPKQRSQLEDQYRSKFIPIAKPCDTFQLPILQVVSSPVTSSIVRVDRAATALLVRLSNCTHLLNLVPNGDYVPPTTVDPVGVIRVAKLATTDTEGRRHVDVALDAHSGSWSKAAVVDDGGGVWYWQEEKQRPNWGMTEKVATVKKLRSAVNDSADGFYRVTFGTRPGTLLVLSRKTLDLIDLEQLETPVTRIITLPAASEEMFTDIDKSAVARESPFVCITTTKKLIWLDDNCNTVLSWLHRYGSNNVVDLGVTVISSLLDDQHETVIVQARSVGVCEAVKITASPPVKIIGHPWSVSGLSTPERPLFNLAVIPFHSPADLGLVSTLVGLSCNGDVFQAQLFDGVTPLLGEDSVNPTPDQENEDTAVGSEPNDVVSNTLMMWEKKAETRSNKYEGRWAWSAINDRPLGPNPTGGLDVPTFQQWLGEPQSPARHVLTAAELFRNTTQRGGEDEDLPKLRSSLLRPLLLRQRGDTASQLQDIDYSKTFPFVADVCAARRGELDLLKDAPTPCDVGGSSSQAEHDTARLRSDLLLSSIVISPELLGSVSATNDSDGVEGKRTPLTVATSDLSLEDKSPKSPTVPFDILTPRSRNNHRTRMDLQSKPKPESAAVRALLREWTIGQDPHDYEWSGSEVATGSRQNSRAPSPVQISSSVRPIRPLPSSRSFGTPSVGSAPVIAPVARRSIVPSFSMGPYNLSQPSPVPFVRPTSGLAAASGASSPPRPARSSPPPVADQSSFALSQTDFPQTQVERGPFGARPETVKARKKPAKKRMGGF